MFKTAYEAYGTLSITASSGVVLFTVNAGLATYLDGLLGVGDWTYLRLESGANVEVVKVTSVTGNILTVVRSIDGTGPYAYAVGTELRYYLPQQGVVDIVNANYVGANITITGAGATTVLESPVNTFVVTTPVPTFTGEGGAIVTGNLVTGFTIALEPNIAACCSGGTGTGTGTGVQSVVGGGIASANSAAGIVTLTVQPPNFMGAGGMVVTGSWPNFTFTQGAPAGVGTVTSVTASDGLAYTGVAISSVNIVMSNTAVVAGTYGGIAINTRGQITAVPVTLNPVSIITAGAGLTYARVGDAVTLTPVLAAIAVPGIVDLADHTVPLSVLDTNSAVTPALLAAVLDTITGPTLQNYDSYIGEAIGVYTNVLATTNITLNLLAGETALVLGTVTMTDTVTPTNVVNFALALLNTTPALVRGNKTMPQCQQTISTVIVGPSTATIRLATSAIPVNGAVQSMNIWVIKL